MEKKLMLLLCIGLSLNSKSQTIDKSKFTFAEKSTKKNEKAITITSFPQTVPNNKKWIIPINQEILIEVDKGALISGTMCNAYLLSNPNIVGVVNEGEYLNPEIGYRLYFKGLTKVHYANDLTFGITPYAIGKYKQVEEIIEKKVIFYPGQKISVSGCLTSLQILEYNLGHDGIEEENSLNGNGISANENWGISHNLKGRKLIPERFEAEFKEGGKAKIHVTVDKNGTIISNSITSISTQDLKQPALEYISKAKFSKCENQESQEGDITIVFRTR